MAAPRLDPYETLGVSPRASDAEVRAAYRRLVQLHHPDHNGGSAASTRRFEEIQEAYAQIRKRSQGTTSAARESAPRSPPRPPRPGPSSPPDPRLTDMEREVREAYVARERARQAAREAAAQSYERPSDDELGYIKTDDSLGKILADARAQASERFSEVREPVTKRVAELLDDLAAKLNGEGPPRPRK
jgi:curved DNA-binding protein CbpA